MSKVSLPFSATPFRSWQEQLLKELKENTGLLNYHSSIEALSVSLLDLENNQLVKEELQESPWKRMVHVSATNAKQSNLAILNALMQGADAIYIANATSQTNWPELLSSIETAYVSCLIEFECYGAAEHFKQNATPDQMNHCIALHKDGPNFNLISTFDLQQIGANCSTELAGGLLTLHQQLEQTTADKILYFELGIGSEFFIEIAKFRALRQLIKQLEELHQIKIELKILAKTGFCNKSLKDPYTNLLRLSTESLSAIMGGADFVCIQTYDQLSTAGPSAFGQRMALNIGNLISEEAQLSALNDPLQGAYMIEQLTLALLKKSWTLLCDFDEMHQDAPEKLKEAIIQTRNIRLEQFHSGASTLIGINSFFSEFESPKAEWAQSPTAIGLPYLIFDQIAN